MQEEAPHLLAFASLWLTRTSVAVLRKADGSHAMLPVTTGVDQGDPMAPFLFALALPLPEIRRRIQGVLANGSGDMQRQEGMLAASLNHLNDLSLVVPSQLVAEH